MVCTALNGLCVHARAQGLLTQKGGASNERHFEKTGLTEVGEVAQRRVNLFS